MNVREKQNLLCRVEMNSKTHYASCSCYRRFLLHFKQKPPWPFFALKSTFIIQKEVLFIILRDYNN